MQEGKCQIMRLKSIAAAATLRIRRDCVRKLRRAGWSVRDVSKMTGEHVTQVQRWAVEHFQAGGQTEVSVYTPQPGSGLNKGFPAIEKPQSVYTRHFFAEKSNFFCMDDAGNPDVGVFEHPVDEIEPMAEVPEGKYAEVFGAALRYLMRQEPRSMEVVAKEIGCTRAAISRALGLLSDGLGFKALNQKSEQARLNYSRARTKSHKRRSST